MKIVHLIYLVLFFIIVGIFVSRYNDIQSQDEEIKASWSNVINQYQRRADLVPNLVNTVKGYIHHEEKVLVEVTTARSKVGTMQLNTDLIGNSQKLQQFQAAQGELSGALSRLMVVSERYPELKASGLFQDLQAQLEGTENRITVARNRYVQSVQKYNILVRSIPTNFVAMIFNYDVKPNFSVENEKAISTVPAITF